MIVEIKQHPDLSASSNGLDKYNRSKLPGTFEVLYPSKGLDGRYLTGIDEDAVSINSIQNPELKQLKKEEVRKVFDELTSLLNVDLKATNKEFWSIYNIGIRDNLSLDLSNPKHKLQYYVLIANGYAVPELGLVNSPEYWNTKFYISRKEEEAKGRTISRKEKDKAKAELLKLSENTDRLTLVAKYLLGINRIKDGTSPDVIYEEVSKFIEDPKEKRNLTLFLDAVSKDIESLQYKLTVDEAIRKNIIRVREGYFQRANATYGKSLKETLEYLSKVENSGEFASLKEEVDNS